MRKVWRILAASRGREGDTGRRALPQPFNTIAHLVFKPQPAAVASNASSKRKRGLLWRMFSRMSVKARIMLLAPVIAAVGVCIGLGLSTVYYTIAFPHPLAAGSGERAPIVRIFARDGSLIAERGAAHDYLPIDLIPKHVQAAVVATEDRRFFEHGGVDPVGLIRAFFANLRAGRFAQGGSTLTQQLAKNLFLTSERTLARKLDELGLALWLEMRLSKPEILEIYLNRVYFGGGAYGVEAASWRYFDKPAKDLTLAQASIIAGLLKAPSKYSPASNPDAARLRGRIVIEAMADAGVISKASAQKALSETVVFEFSKSEREAAQSDYVIDYVLENMPPLVGDGHAEVLVETTLDARLQKRATDLIGKNMAAKGAPLGASQAAVVVLDNDGGVRAMVGGRKYADSQYNRAVKAHRQPGSAFKPFVYLAALEGGMTPDTQVRDEPLTIGNWSPRNDGGKYQGVLSLRRALAQSVNTVAVRLNQQFGTLRTVAAARRLGIKSDLREDSSISLGTSEVTLLEMTGAYAVLSNGGSRVDPHVVRRVRLTSGKVLFKRDPTPADRVVRPVAVAAMNDMLHAALVSGTGKRAAIANHPAAGKTGTTQDFRDAWFVGYTSHLTAGVWVGNDDGKPMNKVTGGGLPAEIWHQLMQVAHEGRNPIDLPGAIETLPWAVQAPAVPATPMPDGSRAEHMAKPGDILGRQSGVGPVNGPTLATNQPRPPTHPDNRIEDDFIARALADVPREQISKNERTRDWSLGRTLLGGWW